MNKKEHVEQLIGFEYKGIPVSQQKASIPLIVNIVTEFNIKNIIELGTLYGGSSVILKDSCPDINLYTFDKKDLRHNIVKKRKDIIFYKEDILKKDQPSPNVIKLLEYPEPAILFCDNGNKKEEVRTYTKYLKHRDIIGMHDWGTEIFLEDISDIIDRYQLHPIHKNIFKTNGFLVRFFQKK